jgi:hypothetical protein
MRTLRRTTLAPHMPRRPVRLAGRPFSFPKPFVKSAATLCIRRRQVSLTAFAYEG